MEDRGRSERSARARLARAAPPAQHAPGPSLWSAAAIAASGLCWMRSLQEGQCCERAPTAAPKERRWAGAEAGYDRRTAHRQRTAAILGPLVQGSPPKRVGAPCLPSSPRDPPWPHLSVAIAA